MYNIASKIISSLSHSHSIWRLARSEKTPSGKPTNPFQVKSLNKCDTETHTQCDDIGGYNRVRSLQGCVQRKQESGFDGFPIPTGLVR